MVILEIIPAYLMKENLQYEALIPCNFNKHGRSITCSQRKGATYNNTHSLINTKQQRCNLMKTIYLQSIQQQPFGFEPRKIICQVRDFVMLYSKYFLFEVPSIIIILLGTETYYYIKTTYSFLNVIKA